jgi:hypothetical protein
MELPRTPLWRCFEHSGVAHGLMVPNIFCCQYWSMQDATCRYVRWRLRISTTGAYQEIGRCSHVSQMIAREAAPNYLQPLQPNMQLTAVAPRWTHRGTLEA